MQCNVPQLSAVAGTWAWDDRKIDWPDPRHDLWRYLASRGIAHINPRRPFRWSTRLGGHNPFTKHDMLVWRAAGINYGDYMLPPRCLAAHLPPGLTLTLSHSHGLQPVLYAAADGLKIDTLVDVCGPVREDMMAVAAAARPNIRRWYHVHSTDWWRDRMQLGGALFDGHLGVRRQHPLADQNIGLPDGHGMIRNPARWPLLADLFLQG